MAEHAWSVLCYKGCVDRFTNQISLLDVFEELVIDPDEAVPTGEMLPVRLSLVTLWIRSEPERPEKGKARIRFQTPAGSTAREEYELDVDLESGLWGRTILRMVALPFSGDGLYRFTVDQWEAESENWMSCASVPLLIRIRGTAEETLPM